MPIGDIMSNKTSIIYAQGVFLVFVTWCTQLIKQVIWFIVIYGQTEYTIPYAKDPSLSDVFTQADDSGLASVQK